MTELNGHLDDFYWMSQAIEMAKMAELSQEVPVGAVLVLNNEAIAFGYNKPIQTHDPCSHAEIIVLREAAKKIKNYRLLDATLYVTLEPCVMCLGAMVHARIKRLVFAAYDPKTGAVESAFNLANANAFNHKIEILGGVMHEEASELLRTFFRSRRAVNKEVEGIFQEEVVT